MTVVNSGLKWLKTLDLKSIKQRDRYIILESKIVLQIRQFAKQKYVFLFHSKNADVEPLLTSKTDWEIKSKLAIAKICEHFFSTYTFK